MVEPPSFPLVDEDELVYVTEGVEVEVKVEPPLLVSVEEDDVVVVTYSTVVGDVVVVYEDPPSFPFEVDEELL